MLIVHLGSGSPYTYGTIVYDYALVPVKDGHPLNNDGLQNVPSTHYFYEPSLPNFSPMRYIDTPLHSFCTSIILGVTRSYTLSNYIVNFVFLSVFIIVFINLLLKFTQSYFVILLVGLNILFLPYFNHYIGQPMHYLSESIITFLVLIAIMVLNLENNKSPLAYGLLMGILTINYDCFVYIAALLIYFIFYYKFKTVKDYFILFFTFIVPWYVWHYFLFHFNVSPPNLIVDEKLVNSILNNWVIFFKNPLREFCFPFIVSHVGLVIAIKHILGYIYWPSLLFIIYCLNKIKSDLNKFLFTKLIFLILFIYFLLIIFIIPFEWENNSRRSIPIIFVFSFIFSYVVIKVSHSKLLRNCLIVLTVLSFLLSFSDYFFQTPVVQNLQIGQNIRSGPKAPLEVYLKGIRLNLKDHPLMPLNKALQFFQYPKANLNREFLYGYIFSQIFCFAEMLIIFFYLSKVCLISKSLPQIYIFLYLLSLVIRFF